MNERITSSIPPYNYKPALERLATWTRTSIEDVAREVFLRPLAPDASDRVSLSRVIGPDELDMKLLETIKSQCDKLFDTSTPDGQSFTICGQDFVEVYESKIRKSRLGIAPAAPWPVWMDATVEFLGLAACRGTQDRQFFGFKLEAELVAEPADGRPLSTRLSMERLVVITFQPVQQPIWLGP